MVLRWVPLMVLGAVALASTLASAGRPACPEVVATYDSGEVEITWNKVEDAEGYRVLRRVGGGPFSMLGQTGAEETRLVDRDVAEGSVYEYRVIALFGEHESVRCPSVAVAPVPFSSGSHIGVGLLVGGISLLVGAVVLSRRG